MDKPTSNHFSWVIAYMAFALFGFADSAYLTASHYLGSLPVCTVLEGCDEVALSEYATIGPVPIALLGSLFYSGLLVIGVVWLDTKKPFLFRYLPFVTVPAFLFSMWLVYVMFFVINALCIYCLMSAGSTTLIMLLSIRFRRVLLH
ncbi:MAG: vitamin K epoxide reductase family protein [Balneolaceae bacterium]|nr:vitamin K epoxide reductase family protein [Balneolaceae bacterium]